MSTCNICSNEISSYTINDTCFYFIQYSYDNQTMKEIYGNDICEECARNKIWKEKTVFYSFVLLGVGAMWLL